MLQINVVLETRIGYLVQNIHIRCLCYRKIGRTLLKSRKGIVHTASWQYASTFLEELMEVTHITLRTAEKPPNTKTYN